MANQKYRTTTVQRFHLFAHHHFKIKYIPPHIMMSYWWPFQDWQTCKGFSEMTPASKDIHLYLSFVLRWEFLSTVSINCIKISEPARIQDHFMRFLEWSRFILYADELCQTGVNESSWSSVALPNFISSVEHWLRLAYYLMPSNDEFNIELLT